MYFGKLASGESRAIGLYDVYQFAYLFGLGVGITWAVFHVLGMTFIFMMPY